MMKYTKYFRKLKEIKKEIEQQKTPWEERNKDEEKSKKHKVKKIKDKKEMSNHNDRN
jgi:hypothetical protein